MPDVLTADAPASARAPKPHHRDWWRWLIDEWQAPEGYDKAYMVALLGALNLKGHRWRFLLPENDTLMRQMEKSRSWVQRYRDACIECELIRPAEQKRYIGSVLVIEICYSARRWGSSGATLGAADETPIAKSKTNSK
jgi:hypothetical protein